MHNVDLRRTGGDDLSTLFSEGEIQFVGLRPEHLTTAVKKGFRGLRGLSIRHLAAPDLSVLKAFPELEILEVWQSEQVGSLAGLERLPRLRWLALSELGPLQTLRPLPALAGSLQELILTGGTWKDQKLSGGLDPVGTLKNLERLTIANVRGPSDLSPLLGLPRLQYLSLATALFPIDEVARVAAGYEFWRERRPWLHRLHHPEPDPDGCPKCQSSRLILLLKGKKRIWCEICDASRLEKVLSEFDLMVQHHLHTHDVALTNREVRIC